MTIRELHQVYFLGVFAIFSELLFYKTPMGKCFFRKNFLNFFIILEIEMKKKNMVFDEAGSKVLILIFQASFVWIPISFWCFKTSVLLKAVVLRYSIKKCLENFHKIDRKCLQRSPTIPLVHFVNYLRKVIPQNNSGWQPLSFDIMIKREKNRKYNCRLIYVNLVW